MKGRENGTTIGRRARSATRARRLAALVLAAAGALALAPVCARASWIVFRCGANLCRIQPDGSQRTQLTTDGQAGSAAQYGSPSLSADGTKLAFTFNSEVVVGDALAQQRGAPFAPGALVTLLKRDGSGLAEIESTVAGTQVCTYGLDGSGRTCPYGTGSAGWAPDGSLLASISAGAPNYEREICDLPSAGTSSAGCPVKADDPNHDLYDPAVSPDGALLAVTVSSGPPGGPVTGHIALYDYATGTFARDLTNGTTDEQPAWSPDGSQIVFTRGSQLYAIAANGAPGSERLLTDGDSPTWGGGTDATGSSGGGSGSSSGSSGSAGGSGGSSGGALLGAVGHVPRRVAATAGLRVRVGCHAACHIVVKLVVSSPTRRRLHLHATTLASASASLHRAGTATLRLRLSRALRRALRHRHVAATLTIAVGAPGRSSGAGSALRHVTIVG